MAQPRITVIINGTTYSLCAEHVEAIGNMPFDDRQHLITLLEAIRRGDNPPSATEARPLDMASIAAPSTRPVPAAVPARMGSGDVDALMARLAAEEQLSRKPALTRGGLYKVMGGLLLLIVLLVMIL